MPVIINLLNISFRLTRGDLLLFSMMKKMTTDAIPTVRNVTNSAVVAGMVPANVMASKKLVRDTASEIAPLTSMPFFASPSS